jgi:predicted NBD/HSP70 family sugar kinase
MQSTVLAREEFTTNPNAEKTLSTLIDCVRKFLRAHKEMEGIGISSRLSRSRDGQCFVHPALQVERLAGDGSDEGGYRTTRGS